MVKHHRFHWYVESNEQNKQSGNRLIDAENRLTTIRWAGVGCSVKKVKGVRKEKLMSKKRYNCMVINREKGVGETEEGEVGINGDRRSFDFGWWTHSIIYRWCVIELYTWNLYNFINNITPINSIKQTMTPFSISQCVWFSPHLISVETEALWLRKSTQLFRAAGSQVRVISGWVICCFFSPFK